MRYAARTDANKAAIVKALRDAGCYVHDLKLPVDLLVSKAGNSWLVEIKDGAKVPSARKLTKLQTEFMRDWTGPPVVVVMSAEQAAKAIAPADEPT